MSSAGIGNLAPGGFYSKTDLEDLKALVWRDLTEGPLVDRAVSLRQDIKHSITVSFIKFKEGERS